MMNENICWQGSANLINLEENIFQFVIENFILLILKFCVAIELVFVF